MYHLTIHPSTPLPRRDRVWRLVRRAETAPVKKKIHSILLPYRMATPKRTPVTKRKDFTQTALDVVRQATGEATTPAPAKKPEDGRKEPVKKASTKR